MIHNKLVNASTEDIYREDFFLLNPYNFKINITLDKLTMLQMSNVGSCLTKKRVDAKWYWLLKKKKKKNQMKSRSCGFLFSFSNFFSFPHCNLFEVWMDLD
ncbi:hypothetical protein BCR42DRAFT_51736 [Absidia repens]|uniref:Uncharacterized protein n=1 Tax=Absidia repens TaxID=90262 RepID=A0A1X2IF36_9FUNG|nr:hypothetical protein BCR42DRAFT_51736 [Absidia repens]